MTHAYPDNRFLRGNFAPLRLECDAPDLVIDEGQPWHEDQVKRHDAPEEAWASSAESLAEIAAHAARNGVRCGTATGTISPSKKPGRKAPSRSLPSGGGCTLETIYFGYNDFGLSGDATSRVDRNAQCIKQQNRAVNLIGRTDPRGTTDYNLSLSEKRAQAVRERLGRLGVPESNISTLPRGELDASGTDEAGWYRDRNVEFQWR